MARTVALALLVALSVVPSSAHAQTRLSGDTTFPELGVGDVEAFAVTFAGGGSGTLLYLADQERDNLPELYAVPLDGGAWVKVSAPLEEGESVVDFRVSPDGQVVAYRGRRVNANRVGLHLARLDGTPLGQASAGVPVAEAITETYEFSPDSAWIVFHTDDGNDRLYRASTDGSTPTVEITGVARTLVEEFKEDLFEMSPTEARVAYRGELSFGATVLYVVPLATGIPQALTPTPTLKTYVAPPSFTPDGSRVVYRYSPKFQVEPLDLYSIPADGSASPTLLYHSPFGVSVVYHTLDAGGQNVYYRRGDVVARVPVDGSSGEELLIITPGGTLAFYDIAPDESRIAMALLDGPYYRLYVAPAQPGGVPQLLSDPLETMSIDQDFEFSQDGNHVLYQIFDRFLTVPSDGSQASTQLSTAPVDPVPRQFEFLKTPDGADVLWVEGLQAQLYKAPVDGSSPPVALSPPYAEISSYDRQYALSPDLTRALYLGDEGAPTPFTNDQATEVFSASLTGPLDTLLHTPPITPLMDGDVKDFVLSGDGSTVAFLKGDFSTDVIYSSPVDGSGGPHLASGFLANDELTSRELFELDSTGQWLMHRRDDVTGQPGVFIGPADASVPPTRVIAGDVAWARLTPDTTRVFALADTDGDGQYEPWVAPMDLSGPVYELVGIGNVTINGFIGQPDELIAFTNASDRVVFLATFLADVVLAVAPLDGSAPPVALTQGVTLPVPPFAAGSPERLLVPPGDTHLVFGLGDSGGRGRLYGVPLDASAAPVQLNTVEAVLHSTLEPTGDGQWLIGFVDSGFPRDVVRFSVDGSSPPLTLAVEASRFALSEDGQLLGSIVLGVLSVQPVDGSSPPVVISPAETVFFGRGASAHKVFYRRDDFGNDGMWTRRVDATDAAIRISAAASTSAPVAPRLSPDGRRLFLFTSLDGVGGLFATPFEEPLEGPPVTGTRQLAFPQEYQLTSDGKRVVYRAAPISQYDELFSIVVRPIVGRVVPRTALLGAPDAVTIRGSGFLPGSTVTFGGLPASVTYVSSTRLRVVPPVPPRFGRDRDSLTVDVTVSDGFMEGTLEGGFTYRAPVLEPPTSKQL